jgi:hypothetical protein
MSTTAEFAPVSVRQTLGYFTRVSEELSGDDHKIINTLAARGKTAPESARLRRRFWNALAGKSSQTDGSNHNG